MKGERVERGEGEEGVLTVVEEGKRLGCQVGYRAAPFLTGGHPVADKVALAARLLGCGQGEGRRGVRCRGVWSRRGGGRCGGEEGEGDARQEGRETHFLFPGYLFSWGELTSFGESCLLLERVDVEARTFLVGPLFCSNEEIGIDCGERRRERGHRRRKRMPRGEEEEGGIGERDEARGKKVKFGLTLEEKE